MSKYWWNVQHFNQEFSHYLNTTYKTYKTLIYIVRFKIRSVINMGTSIYWVMENTILLILKYFVTKFIYYIIIANYQQQNVCHLLKQSILFKLICLLNQLFDFCRTPFDHGRKILSECALLINVNNEYNPINKLHTL